MKFPELGSNLSSLIRIFDTTVEHKVKGRPHTIAALNSRLLKKDIQISAAFVSEFTEKIQELFHYI